MTQAATASPPGTSPATNPARTAAPPNSARGLQSPGSAAPATSGVVATPGAVRADAASGGISVPAPASAADLPPFATRGRVRLTLRLVIPGVAAGLLAAALLVAGTIWERDSRKVLVRELETRLVLEARHLALAGASAILDPYPELTLQPLIRDLMRARPEIESALVLDRERRIVGHRESDLLGKIHSPSSELGPLPSEIVLLPGEQLLGDPSRLVATTPVRLSSGEVLGTALVAVRRSYLDGVEREARRHQIFVVIATLLAGTLAMLLSIVLLLRPVPSLRRGIERIGRGDLDTPIALRDGTEFGMLAETLDRMASQLKSAQREALERERLSREMELARTMQRSLLPQGRQQAGRCLLVGSQVAATEVGGDYFDILPLGGDRFGIAIADVAGKGIGGCLVMTMLSALLRAFRELHSSPAAMLAAIDRSLAASLPRGGFVTMTYGVLDGASGQVTFASAGHLPALLYRARSAAVEWRRPKAVPIGALRRGGIAAMLDDVELALEPGDLLVQFTDGYSEAPERSSREQFGFARLEAVVCAHAGEGPEAVAAAIDAAVGAWAGSESPRDDQTLLVVAHVGSPDEGAGSRMAASQAMTSATADPVAGGSAAAERSPLELLAEAERHGHHLTLEGRLEDLPRLRPWLREWPGLQALDPRAARLLESALYETCANIVEHGHAIQPPAAIDLWWLPRRQSMPAASTPTGAAPECLFVIRDRGQAFDPSTASEADFDNPQVRKRGRGLGITMIRRIMADVHYAASTPQGNLTVMRFDPGRLAHTEETPNG